MRNGEVAAVDADAGEVGFAAVAGVGAGAEAGEAGKALTRVGRLQVS